jgi:ABC-type antimicrobial peptide transport system permease subunit
MASSFSSLARPCRSRLEEFATNRLTLSLTGLALGLVGAWWLGRAGSSLLFGVTASDPLTFTTVSLLLTAVATAACYFPARRAMTVDPIVALRVT